VECFIDRDPPRRRRPHHERTGHSRVAMHSPDAPDRDAFSGASVVRTLARGTLALREAPRERCGGSTSSGGEDITPGTGPFAARALEESRLIACALGQFQRRSLAIIESRLWKREEREDKNGGWRERTYGRFERMISLPSEVDPEKVSAQFKNGALTASLPKSQAAVAPSRPARARTLWCGT
jgi:hypothetical protein